MQPPNETHDEDVNDAVALAAIQLLVQDFPRARQKDAARRIYDLLREEYGRAGPRSPGWMQSLKELVDAEFR